MSIYTAVRLDPDRRYDPPDEIECDEDKLLLSECCGADSQWGLDDDNMGLCGDCGEHAEFKRGDDSIIGKD